MAQRVWTCRKYLSDPVLYFYKLYSETELNEIGRAYILQCAILENKRTAKYNVFDSILIKYIKARYTKLK